MEANSALKLVFMKENVPKILLQNAFEAFRNNPDCKEDCERKATAYIFRHTAASALEWCGLKEGEIFRAMGHKMEDSDYHNEDFSNPDVFCSFSRKTDLRPITMLFNGDPTLHCQLRRRNTVTRLICPSGNPIYRQSAGHGLGVYSSQ